MTIFSLKFSATEIELLISLASDQLFRKEFIDPRQPGYKSNAAQVSAGKKLVERLQLMTDRAHGLPLPKIAV